MITGLGNIAQPDPIGEKGGATNVTSIPLDRRISDNADMTKKEIPIPLNILSVMHQAGSLAGKIHGVVRQG